MYNNPLCTYKYRLLRKSVYVNSEFLDTLRTVRGRRIRRNVALLIPRTSLTLRALRVYLARPCATLDSSPVRIHFLPVMENASLYMYIIRTVNWNGALYC